MMPMHAAANGEVRCPRGVSKMPDGSHRITWDLSSSSDRRALDVVDGVGRHAGRGPHYSRRTPGSKTFTGVGQEIVLVTSCGRAVWACIRQKTPAGRAAGVRPQPTARLDLSGGT
jgi:hypothetical protein